MRDIVRLKTERELMRITIDDGNAFWKEIGVNAVYAARHTLPVVRHKLMLLGITYYCWASAKVKIINRERQIQALVDKKKAFIKTSIRSDLNLDDAEGIDCLPSASIFTKQERMGKGFFWKSHTSISRVESSNDASLGAQEDASKQGRKIEDLDADAEVTLVKETQEMNDDPTR
ncbi:hypothetical protein Tco_1296274, partial [Tanacetum coccineum]